MGGAGRKGSSKAFHWERRSLFVVLPIHDGRTEVSGGWLFEGRYTTEKHDRHEIR